MCGILYFDVSGMPPDDVDAVRALANTLAHRGPDGSVCEIIGDRHLMAFHRLAVINTSEVGMQPVHEGNASLICNGDVYNYREIAEVLGVDGDALGSDVHVLVHALACEETIGDALACVDGEFALVYRAGGRVVAARDPWGVRPLFTARDVGGRLLGFASEAKALIGAPNVVSVTVFPPGHYIMVRERPGQGQGLGQGPGGSEETCRDYRGQAHRDRHVGRLLDLTDSSPERTVRRLVEAAIMKRVHHSDRAVGLLCSGGLDSSIVTALVASDPSLREHIRVFSVRYDAGHSDDASYAATLCSQCRVELEMVSFGIADVIAAITPVIRACESCDPNTVRAAIPMYLLAKHVASQTDIKVVLSGEGADELFCGYAHMRLAPDAESLNAESQRLVRQLHMFDLLRADRCFAAFGLEVRVPYLDLDLVDYISDLHGSVKKISADSGFVEKRLLRDAFRDASTPVGRLLQDARVIDRRMEKLSDGCGSSFVPHLLTHLGGTDSSRLDDREAAERAYYKDVFDSIYGKANRALVASWVMPVWSVD